MNSKTSDDTSREQFALATAKCLKNIYENSQKVTTVHKELLDINLSVAAYVEESKSRLETFRLHLANSAPSSQRVVEILSDKCLPLTPPSRKSHRLSSIVKENNNNIKSKFSKQQSARKFSSWYKNLIDNDRQNLCLYLSDDIVLEWFGKTIKTRKKASFFLKHDMQCSRHDFTSIESIDSFPTRHVQCKRSEDSILASPLHSPEIGLSRRSNKRKHDICKSPEWAEGCKPNDEDDDIEATSRKRVKIHDNISQINIKSEVCNDISSKGDGMSEKCKRKLSVTPPNKECGQGDCLPSTSGASNSEASHDTLNAQLPKLALECNGYIEFTRTRNNRSADSMKWERKCKVQISYSEDPLNVGEYVIWALRYSDESKCRRNLLAAFEEASKE